MKVLLTSWNVLYKSKKFVFVMSDKGALYINWRIHVTQSLLKQEFLFHLAHLTKTRTASFDLLGNSHKTCQKIVHVISYPKSQ